MRYLRAALPLCLLALPGLTAPGDAPAGKTAAPANGARSIVNTLKTRRVTVEMEGRSLDELVKFLTASSGINIVVAKNRIEKDGGDVDAIEITLKVTNVPVGDVLELALAPLDLGMKIQGNVLIITSKKDARGKPVLKIYPVAHLLIQLRDFPAPDMNIYPSNYEPPEPPEPEVTVNYESSEELAELVRTVPGRDTWEDEGVTITVFRKHLFIRTYPAVHGEIQALLDRLPR